MTDKPAPLKDDSLDIQNIQVKIKVIDPKGKGFLPLYRKMIAAKRALNDFEKAQPEDIDLVYGLLSQHITEPASQPEKVAVIDMLSVDDLGKLFDKILGAGTVNPTNAEG